MRGRLGFTGGDVGQVLNDFFRVLSLAGARLAGAENALVLTIWNEKKKREGNENPITCGAGGGGEEEGGGGNPNPIRTSPSLPPSIFSSWHARAGRKGQEGPAASHTTQACLLHATRDPQLTSFLRLPMTRTHLGQHQPVVAAAAAAVVAAHVAIVRTDARTHTSMGPYTQRA